MIDRQWINVVRNYADNAHEWLKQVDCNQLDDTPEGEEIRYAVQRAKNSVDKILKFIKRVETSGTWLFGEN